MTTSLHPADYALLRKQMLALLEDESDLIANLANVSALLYQELRDVNWVGFYFRNAEGLVLGPFQGRPACVRIPWGVGVCGTSALKQKTFRIDDVHEFPGHIACDTASNAELVIPLTVDGEVYAVLDIDSPVRARFSPADQAGLELLVKAMLAELGPALRNYSAMDF